MCRFKVTNFKVDNIRDNWWRPLKHQRQQLRLSRNPADYIEVPKSEEMMSSAKFITHLPFNFTRIEDLNRCGIGQIIDVVGYVHDISEGVKTNHGDIHAVCIGSSRSMKDPKKPGCVQELTLMGHSIDKLTKRFVYAIKNVQVCKRFERRVGECKVLRTTGNTLIVKIESRNLQKIPPKYRLKDYVLNLLPRQYKQDKRATTKASYQLEDFGTVDIPQTKTTYKSVQQANNSFNLGYFPYSRPLNLPLNLSTNNSQNQAPQRSSLSNYSSLHQLNDTLPTASRKSCQASVSQTSYNNFYSPGHSGYNGTPYDDRDPLKLASCSYSNREGQDRSPMHSSTSSVQSPGTPEKYAEGLDPYYRRTTPQYPPSVEQVADSNSQQSSIYPTTSVGSSPSNTAKNPSSSIKRPGLETNLESASSKRLRYELSEELSDFPDVEYDFVNNNEALKVIVKPSLHYMDLNPRTCYSMRSNTRGIVLIISNYFYPDRPNDDVERIREGGNKDVEYLANFFDACKFKVISHWDAKAAELQGHLDDFKANVDENMDAVIVVILSHGLNGLVEMVDGKFVRLPNDIIHQFDANAFLVITGKPKMFLIQTCQNIPSEDNVAQILPPSLPCMEQERRNNVELENMLVCYAAAPGMESTRDKYIGSHFIYVLIHVLMTHSHDNDFMTLLKLTQHRLTKVKRVENNVLHCNWDTYHFNKKLYFNPGL